MTTEEFLKKTSKTLEQKKYSQATTDAYLQYVKDYLLFCKQHKLTNFQKALPVFIKKQRQSGLSNKTINLSTNAIKFFYREIEKKEIIPDAKYYKTKDNKITILKKTEIERLLTHTKNDKHHLLFALAYSSGLKLQELLDLKVRDINFENLVINVHVSKNVSHETILSKKLQEKLKTYISDKKPTNLVFESTHGGRLTERSIQISFDKVKSKAKINKKASFISLRHTFAVHMLSAGLDTKVLQKLMGHKNIRTTNQYKNLAKVDISSISSPL